MLSLTKFRHFTFTFTCCCRKISLSQAFRPLRQLQQLWMSGNRLRAVPSGLPASLQRLLLDFNRIENLTDVFPTNSQVDHRLIQME